MKIKTHYDPKPIPMRQFDWNAVDDDTYDYDGPVGWGYTEKEAIGDLIEQLAEQLEYKEWLQIITRE
jgi:hypothetical protein